MQKRRIFGLDLLRAIAIMLVISSHCTFLLFPNSESLVLNVIRGFGAIGVDLFFILSGYLIGNILLKNIENEKFRFSDLINFWKRRWFRTLPNYFLILIANVFLIFLFDAEIPLDIWRFFIFLQNFSSPHPNFFTEAWSLSIEEYAYLIVPLLIYLTIYVFKSKSREKLFFIVTITTILVLSVVKLNYFLSVNVDSIRMWSSTFRKVLVYRLDAIYIGFILIYLMRNSESFFKKYKTGIAFVAMLLFVLMHFIIFKFEISPKTHLGFFVFIYLQVVLVSLSLLFPYFVEIDFKGTLKKVVVYISIRSYAIYLINYSLVLLTIDRFINVEELQFSGKILVLTLYLVVTILLSEILYRFFEKPILDFRNRKFPN